MMRRTLSETLIDVSESLLGVQQVAQGVRLTQVRINLPIELSLVRRGGQLVVLADVPRWRWRTPFDPEPGRMVLQYGAHKEK